MAVFSQAEPTQAYSKKPSQSNQKFTSGADLRQALRSTNDGDLVKAFTSLRAQLSTRFSEKTLPPSDERLVFLREWLDGEPDVQCIFDIWSQTNARQTIILVLIVSTLSSLLDLISSSTTDLDLGRPVVNALLTYQASYRLNTYLSGTHSELILVSLKLWNSLSSYRSGDARKIVMDAFAWEAKALSKLLFMRRKGKSADSGTSLSRPDIRTYYMLFVLSFIQSSTPTAVKASFMERSGEHLRSIFKGLFQDSYVVIRHVLELCWTGLWSDVKVKRTAKIQVFNESTITQVAKLYERDEAEDDVDDHIPADVAHHFLLALCTRPGTGLCFQDRGWYARASADDEVARAEDRPGTSKTDTGRVFNKILANVLRGLRPNEDVRQQELALKIMHACPELVASFWSGAGLTMEPRLSSRWLANIALFGSIIALPVPSRSFLLPGTYSQYHLIPPPLATLLENVLPSVGTKVHISKGLQSPSPMVQHACALALSRCLYKLDDVIKCFRNVEMANEETEETGRWTSRRRELELEARRRVPDFQVILAFVQQYQKTADVNHAKVVLLAELGQRLLWLYHALLPALVSENRFDPSKLLQQFAEDAEPTSSSSSDAVIAKIGLHALRRIHALRLLAEADPIALSAKSSPSSRSNMHVLLKQYLSARETAIQSGIMTLIRRQLGESLLFQHDVSEVDTWLSALRQTPSAPSSSAQPESQPRLEGLVDFIDDSVQRCLKTPYRYLDQWDHIVTSSQHDEHGERIMASPLIMTILEQLCIKVAGSLMSTASVFEVLAFIRQLVFVLCTSHATFAPFQEYTTRLYDFVKQWNLPVSPLEAASRREVAVLSASLLLLKDGPKHVEASLDSDVDFAHRQFAWVFIQTSSKSLEVPANRSLLVGTALRSGASLEEIKRAIRVILFRLSSPTSLTRPQDLVYLLSEVMAGGSDVLSGQEVPALKRFVFEESSVMSTLCRDSTLPMETRTALESLVKMNLNPAHIQDVIVARPIAEHCMTASANETTDVVEDGTMERMVLWAPYATCTQRLLLLDGLAKLGSPLVVSETTYEALRIVGSAMTELDPALDIMPSMAKLEILRNTYVEHPAIGAQIDVILASVAASHSPLGLNGFSNHSGAFSLPDTCNMAVLQWRRSHRPIRHHRGMEDTASSLSDAQAELLLYDARRDSDARKQVSDILEASRPSLVEGPHVLYFMDALLDATIAAGEQLPTEYTAVVFQHAVDLLINHRVHVNQRRIALSYASHLLEASPQSATKCLPVFMEAVGSMAIDRFTYQTVAFAALFRRLDVDGAKAAISTVVEHGLRWVVRYYAEDLVQTEDLVACVDGLADLISSTLKTHLAEPVIDAVIQHRLYQVSALRLGSRVIASTSLKPITVNKFIQTLLQHPHLNEYASGTSKHPSMLRESVIDILATLFNTHPSNTCQPSHIEPLLNLYHGTVSKADREILGVFQLFESQRAASVSSLFSRWSYSPGHNSAGTALDALRSLDSITVFRSCLSFPRSRRLTRYTPTTRSTVDDRIYDPVFVLLLFSTIVQHQVPDSAMGWVELFRTNVVSLLISTLSAKDSEMRELAIDQLALLYSALESADMQEKPLVFHILNLLKGLYVNSSNDAIPWIPTYTTLLLAHALRGVFYPSNFIYPLTARFLLQRPTLDPTDVPMLLGMLYSSGDDWKKERAWIIRFLADGMTCGRDWKVFKRRHTWDLVSSLFQCSETDRVLRQGVLELLTNLTSIQEAATSLILKSALLPWIEAQLQNPISAEIPSWVRILENILIVPDHGKLEAASSGSWRSTVGRCILSLLRQTSDIGLLPMYTDVLLRLTELPGADTSCIGDSLQEAVRLLTTAEAALGDCVYIYISAYTNDASANAGRPHRANSALHANPDPSFTLDLWSICAENLWRASMQMDTKSSVWEELSARLLFWRSIAGTQASPMSEWLRREVVRILQTSI